jgi:hypothetical protein
LPSMVIKRDGDMVESPDSEGRAAAKAGPPRSEAQYSDGSSSVVTLLSASVMIQSFCPSFSV